MGSEAQIRWISGPVLRAASEGAFRINEAVRVGPKRLLGEVIGLSRGEIIAQVYEDTSGLRPGDTIVGTGLPLAVRLGPGVLGHIFDGLLRPLGEAQSPFISPGMYEAPARRFPFEPMARRGDRLEAGAIFGRTAHETARDQSCLIPPNLHGRVERIAGAGEYDETESLCTLVLPSGQRQEISMSHRWPVRHPRPGARRLPVAGPMLTGQRVLDTLFPLARGGRAALPGGFGTGKTILQESLAKFSDADIIVYVGCGERGNEMAGVLEEFPQLEDPRTGKPLMDRTVIIANTSNMPVAAREASIYTGVTVAEYFRDQGLHVALMADSTSRWAEALREVSGRLGELPGEGGYPAYLSSRLATFYERAARVRTLAGEEGSLSIIGAVSPPSGDFSEPVTTHTKRYVRCFWTLDRTRAHARFFPAIDPLSSYSEDASVLEEWWRRSGNSRWAEYRLLFLSLLEQQAHLERMARIIGKDALPPDQQVTLLCAELINEGFLRQSALSPTDAYASPERQTAMQRVIVRFVKLARKAVAADIDVEEIRTLDVFRRLQRMGEEIPEGDLQKFDDLAGEVDTEFARLHREAHES